MRKLLPIFMLLILAPLACAQCTGSGLAYSCPSTVTSAQLQSALGTASDGAVFTFAAGTYTGFTAQVQFSQTKAATFICATAPLSVGAATVNPCLIQANAYAVFGLGTCNITGTIAKAYRISGFTFDLGGTQASTGTIYWDSVYNGGYQCVLSSVREDHNTFQNGNIGAQLNLIGSTGSVMSIYGVFDHNLVTNTAGQMSLVNWVSNLGSTSTFPSAALGTANNLFIENNTFTFPVIGSPSAEGCTDGWGGAAFVARYNQTKNCLWASHGETHQGGPQNWEFYNNQIQITDTTQGTNIEGCYHCFHSQGSGTFVGFGNVLTPYSGKDPHAFVQAHYRGTAGANASYSVTSVAVSGSTVTYTGTGMSGAPNGWYNFSGFSNAGNNTFTQITSSTSTTLVGTTARSLGTQVNETHSATANFSSVDGSAPQCDGTVAPPATTLWSLDGNRSPTSTWRGYPCFNQPGRDYQGNYHPQYAWNNLYNDGTQVPFVIEDDGGPIDYYANHIVQNRDYYDATSNLPNGSGGTFTGATGTGWGPLANRPSACTTSTETAYGKGAAGTAYFATDVGAQGTLYTCTATGSPGTWAVFYTPYTYPHPLVTGSSTVTLTPAAMSFTTNRLTTSAAQTATLTNGTASSISISSISISGLFGQTNTCGPTLGAGANCTFSVTFSPNTTGPFSGTLTVNTSSGTYTVALSGTGTAPIISLTPASYTFPNTYVTTQSTYTFSLQNTGNGPLNVVFSLTGSSYFTIYSTSCPSILAAGNSCNVTVSFIPLVASTFVGSLVETDSVQGISGSAALNGTGVSLTGAPTSTCNVCILE